MDTHTHAEFMQKYISANLCSAIFLTSEQLKFMSPWQQFDVVVLS